MKKATKRRYNWLRRLQGLQPCSGGLDMAQELYQEGKSLKAALCAAVKRGREDYVKWIVEQTSDRVCGNQGWKKCWCYKTHVVSTAMGTWKKKFGRTR